MDGILLSTLFTYYIAAQVMDIVIEGLYESRIVTIIPKEYVEISQSIQDCLGRSTTFIYANGGYMQEHAQMIHCVMTRMDLTKLKDIVHVLMRIPSSRLRMYEMSWTEI